MSYSTIMDNELWLDRKQTTNNNEKLVDIWFRNNLLFLHYIIILYNDKLTWSVCWCDNSQVFERENNNVNDRWRTIGFFERKFNWEKFSIWQSMRVNLIIYIDDMEKNRWQSFWIYFYFHWHFISLLLL